MPTYAEVAEEQKWQEFADNMEARTPSAQLPDGCTNCQVGSRWKQEDNERLVSLIKPGVTLEHICRELNRSLLGVTGRLSMLGLIFEDCTGIRRPSDHYQWKWAWGMSRQKMEYRYKYNNKKVCFTMFKFMEENHERLGWEKVKHGYCIPSGMNQQPVEKGNFNPQYKRRPEVIAREKEKKAKGERLTKVERQAKKERQESFDRLLRARHPKYKRDGTLDRRYKNQK